MENRTNPNPLIETLDRSVQTGIECFEIAVWGKPTVDLTPAQQHQSNSQLTSDYAQRLGKPTDTKGTTNNV